MRSESLDVPTALAIGRGTLRKMRQNLGWAVGPRREPPDIEIKEPRGVLEPVS